MRMCEDHWQKLRDAVDATGLGTLVSEGGQEAMMKMVAGLQEGPSIDNFDPLMQAHNAIMANTMTICQERGGQASVAELMGAYGDDWCPLCYINEQHNQACEEEGCTYTFDSWCIYAAEEQLKLWKELSST